MAVVFQHKPPGGHERADDGRFDAFGRTQRRKLVPFFRRHGEHHAFLGLGDPNLGVRKPFVFQRHAFRVDLGADLFAHFADGAGQSAGAAIGHGGVQPAVAGGQQHVEHHLLGDGVADLHRAAETVSLWLVNSAELNVAPWMPSRPVRPPTTTIRSPAADV